MDLKLEHHITNVPGIHINEVPTQLPLEWQPFCFAQGGCLSRSITIVSDLRDWEIAITRDIARAVLCFISIYSSTCDIDGGLESLYRVTSKHTENRNTCAALANALLGPSPLASSGLALKHSVELTQFSADVQPLKHWAKTFAPLPYNKWRTPAEPLALSMADSIQIKLGIFELSKLKIRHTR